MSESEIKELENTVAVNKDYKKHYHLCDYFEVELIDKLLEQFKQLQQKNQQLKDELETSKQYEDYYKDLCNKALKTGGKYISVIKEIREYIVNDIQHCTYGQVPKYQDILQILDKVKE